MFKNKDETDPDSNRRGYATAIAARLEPHPDAMMLTVADRFLRRARAWARLVLWCSLALAFSARPWCSSTERAHAPTRPFREQGPPEESTTGESAAERRATAPTHVDFCWR